MSSQAMQTLNEPLRKFHSSEGEERALRFRSFDASDCQFPAPKVPLLARLTKTSLGFSPSPQFSPITTDRPYRFYSRGRYALHEAYARAGVGPQGALLVPAYHCRTMLDPAIRLNGKVIFYPLDNRLVPDVSSLVRLVDQSDMPVRALLLTHYFGFSQPSAEIQSFCSARGIVLIEDCSHAYFRHQSDQSLGKAGRFAVASPYKFCPAEDGGVLIANDGVEDLPSSLVNPGIAEQIRSVARQVKSCFQGKCLDAEGSISEALQKIRFGGIALGSESVLSGERTSALYFPQAENKAGLLFSYLITRMGNADRIAEVRRANYQRWLNAVRGLPGCRPLFDELPEHVVPYMFPLYIEHPDPHFYVLKKLGLPIYRWDEMAVSDCQIAMDYRLGLLHLPCHQTLDPSEIDWMTRVVAKVMTEIPKS